jgi:hypothetical protein
MFFKSVNTLSEIVVHSDLDKGVWVPFYDGSWFQPCFFDCSGGNFANILKVLPGSRFAKHYHVQTVHGYTLRGSWRYLEHDWVATPGTYVFEPPGEVHTLVVDEDSETMITFFVVESALIYVDDNGNQLGYDDVYTILEKARNYYRETGLNMAELEATIR